MSYPVTLYIYDLTQGMARSLGPSLGLPNLDGVWHTAIVVHDTEIFFGGGGIEHCLPGATMLGQPLEKKLLGHTGIDMENLTLYLRHIGSSEFHGSRYDLFNHNCNNFSSSLAKFLGVQDIPQHILDLPKMVLGSPIAALLKPIIEQATPDGQGTTFGADATASANSRNDFSSASSSHFPPKEYSVIDAPINVDKVMEKLMELNEKNGDKFKLNDDQLTSLRLLTEQGVKLEDGSVIESVLLPALEHWPKEDTFPVWNLICVNVVHQGLDSREMATKLYKIIKTNKLLSYDSPQTRMCLRLLVSYFAKESSRSVMLDHREDIIGDVNTLIEDCQEELSPQVENAVACLVLNYAKAVHDKGGDSEASFQIVSGISTAFLQTLKGPEAIYKTLVALATLIQLDADVKALSEALDIGRKLASIPKGRMARLDQLVAECKALY